MRTGLQDKCLCRAMFNAYSAADTFFRYDKYVPLLAFASHFDGVHRADRGAFSAAYASACGSTGDEIGADCLIVSQAGVAGNVCIGNNVKIFGQVGIANNVEIKDNAVVLAKSRVIKDVKSGDVVSGMYGRSHSQELKLQAQIRKKIREE